MAWTYSVSSIIGEACARSALLHTVGEHLRAQLRSAWWVWMRAAELLEKHLALQERKVWVDSLGACHLRLRGYTFEALPDAVQAKGASMHSL